MFLQKKIGKEEYEKRRVFLETVNTDWFDLLCQSSISTSHNLSFSGGSEKVTYNTSLGYSDMRGQEIGNSTKSLTARVGMDVRLRNNIRLNTSIYGTYGTTDMFGPGVDPMSYATTTSRAIPAFDENGEPAYYQLISFYRYNNNSALSYNFINERDHSGSRVESYVLNASLNFGWDILNWLKYELIAGYSLNTSTRETWALEQTYYIAKNYRGYDYNSVEVNSALFKAAQLPFGGQLFTSNGRTRSYNIQNKLLVSKEFNLDNRLNMMLAWEIRSSNMSQTSNTVWGYLPDRGDILISPTPPDKLESLVSTSPSGFGILEYLYTGSWARTNTTNNYLSFFMTLAYSWKNRYVFNFSLRNDASNRFGQDVNHRIDPTYSFGLAWHMMDESFFKNDDWWVDYLNVRLTYGIQGNAMTRQSPDLILRRGGLLYNQYVSYISSIPNPFLSWEKTYTFNVGADFGLFKIFNLVFDYYTRSSNVIVSQDIAYEYGMSRMSLNGGRIRNSGIEFTVSFTPVQQKDWALNLSLNSSKNWNKAGNQQLDYTRDNLLEGSTDRILKKGYPLSGFWSYSFAGLSPEDGRALFNYVSNTGVLDEVEVNPNIDPADYLVYSGEKEPAFTGGLTFSLRYKNLTLSSGLSLLLGAKKRLPSPFASFMYSGTCIPDPIVNLSKDLNNRWKKPGDEVFTNIPSFVVSNNASVILPDGDVDYWIDMWAQSDEMVVDASFLRCQQVSLSWNVGQRWCERIGLKSFSLNVIVNNIFVIGNKRFNGFDPELGNSVHPKNYSVGINIGF